MNGGINSGTTTTQTGTNSQINSGTTTTQSGTTTQSNTGSTNSGTTNSPLPFTKHFILGLGIDTPLAVIQDESLLVGSEIQEYTFCSERVLPYEVSFLTYGHTSILERCHTLEQRANERVTNTYYFQSNHLGSILGLTNSSGSLVVSYSYDSFGNVTASGVLQKQNTRLFTGREYDSETGFYYYRARHYNPQTGRFLQRDPIGQNDQINLYTYVGNNPVMYVDPMGREGKSFIANNEGNAWYLDSTNLSAVDTGHAVLYYIHGGKEHMINYNPGTSTGLNPFGRGDMFFGVVDGNGIPMDSIEQIRNAIITRNSAKFLSITKIEEEYIDTNKLIEWNKNNSGSLPDYNTFTNNCSTMVDSALIYSGFYEHLPTDIIPGTTPRGLTLDINTELRLKSVNASLSSVSQSLQNDLGSIQNMIISSSSNVSLFNH